MNPSKIIPPFCTSMFLGPPPETIKAVYCPFIYCTNNALILCLFSFLWRMWTETIPHCFEQQGPARRNSFYAVTLAVVNDNIHSFSVSPIAPIAHDRGRNLEPENHHNRPSLSPTNPSFSTPLYLSLPLLPSFLPSLSHFPSFPSCLPSKFRLVKHKQELGRESLKERKGEGEEP